jgi:hypothetical protein
MWPPPSPPTGFSTFGNCVQNEILAGFGFDFGASPDTLELQASYPNIIEGARAWTFALRNLGRVSQTVTFYYQCINGDGVGIPWGINALCPPHDSGPLYASASGSAEVRAEFGPSRRGRERRSNAARQGASIAST